SRRGWARGGAQPIWRRDGLARQRPAAGLPGQCPDPRALRARGYRRGGDQYLVDRDRAGPAAGLCDRSPGAAPQDRVRPFPSGPAAGAGLGRTLMWLWLAGLAMSGAPTPAMAHAIVA